MLETGRLHQRIVLVALAALLVGWTHHTADAQEPRRIKQYHVLVGGGLGIYLTSGGFELGEQEIAYQGFHFDLVRFGVAHAVSQHVRMELAVKLGLSALVEPGYRGPTDQGGMGQSPVGGHLGFEILGYYRFQPGLTLGLGADISVGFGEFLDTSFFRLLPAIGWEFGGGLDDWICHVRWVTGITLLHGLGEANSAPRSNLTWSGLQVVYGF